MVPEVGAAIVIVACPGAATAEGFPGVPGALLVTSIVTVAVDEPPEFVAVIV